MKINFRHSIALLISVYLLSATSFAQSQDKEITFTVFKKADKIFTIDPQGQKTIEVSITGISTQNEMDVFITKFKAIDGVISFNVTAGATSGVWTATATFFERASKKYLQGVLLVAGVKKVIIDGKTMTAEEVGTYSNKSKE
jgi:hypothetical protein